MADIYNSNNFGMDVVSEYPKEDQDIIAEGILFGWTLKKYNQRCVLESHDRTKILEFSSHRRGREKRRPTSIQKRKMLARYAKPTAAAAVLGTLEGVELPDLTRPAQEPVPDRPQEEAIDKMSEAELELATNPTVAVGNDGLTVAERQALAEEYALAMAGEPQPDSDSDSEVWPKEAPLLAHYAKGSDTRAGVSYVSKSVIERTWEDGHKDYKCAYSGCTRGPNGGPYVSGSTQAVASHQRYHIQRGEIEPTNLARVTEEKVVDPSYTTHAYSRKEGPRSRKAETIEHNRAQPPKWTDLFGADPAYTGETLTAEQVVNKIRDLVDMGQYAEMRQALDEMKTQATNAQLDKIKAERERDSAVAELDTMRGEMLAFREMFEGVLGDAGRRALAEQKKSEEG